MLSPSLAAVVVPTNRLNTHVHGVRTYDSFYLEGDRNSQLPKHKNKPGYTLYDVFACGLQASITLFSITLAPSRKHALAVAVSLAPHPGPLCSSLLTVHLLTVVPPAPPPPVATYPCRLALVAPALAAVRSSRHLRRQPSRTPPPAATRRRSSFGPAPTS